MALEREPVLALAARKQPDPAAEHDRQDADRHVVDQIGGEELRDDLAAIDIDPLAAREPGQQAARIPGVTPAAIAILDVYLSVDRVC